MDIQTQRMSYKTNLVENFTLVKDIKAYCFSAVERDSTIVLLRGGGTDSAKLSWGDVILPLAESGQINSPAAR